MRLNFELLVCTFSKPLAAELAAALEKDFHSSRQLELDELAAESRWSQLLESAAHLLSPLL